MLEIISEADIFQDHFKPAVFKHDQVTVVGVSSAGLGTSFYLPEFQTCIDVAQGLPFAYTAKTFLITHSHMDHASGIPYLISQKALQGMKGGVFYMPKSMIEPMKRIMHEWEAMDGHEYEYYFNEAVVGKEYELSKSTYFIPFQTLHRVPSCGYTLFEKKRKLKAEFANLKEKEILELKKKKTEFTEIVNTPIFSYTGDTQIEFWKENPEVLKSKVLFLEATYIDEQKKISSARDWGHTHLLELLPLLGDFQGEKLVITHVSSRYSPKAIKAVLDQKIPPNLQGKIDFFPHELST